MEWKGKTRGGTLGYSFFILIIKTIGIIPAYIFLCLVVPYFIPFAPKATHNIWYYARQRLGLGKFKSVKILFSNYYRLGQILIDKISIGNGMADKYSFEFENYDEFLSLLNKNEGAIIIGAHIGSWEMGAPFFGNYGKRINIVLYDAEYQKIKNILEENSYKAPYKVIPIKENSLSHIFSIKGALDEKDYVCFQGDRYIKEERTLRSAFLGKEALFPEGPFMLAARINTPVIFYYAMREKGRRYHFYFTPADLVNGKRNESQLLQQYVDSLEKILYQYPEQWFNYYPFWKNN